jgi:uncharacterized protein YcgI (DUF1989 family)
MQTYAERIEIPARSARAVDVPAGRTFRVIDVEGGQVGDLFAFAAGDRTEYLSASHTRVHTQRLFPSVGEAFVSNRRRPLLELVADSSPGVHDMLIAACDPERYRALGVDGAHASCAENLQRALGEHVDVPQPVNLFMNIPVRDGRLAWRPAASAPGDAVTLLALADVTVVLSACPQDLVNINGDGPTGLSIELL